MYSGTSGVGLFGQRYNVRCPESDVRIMVHLLFYGQKIKNNLKIFLLFFIFIFMLFYVPNGLVQGHMSEVWIWLSGVRCPDFDMRMKYIFPKKINKE